MTPTEFRLEPEENGVPTGRDAPASTPALEQEVVGSSLGVLRRVLYLLGAGLCALLAWHAFHPDGGRLAQRWWWEVLAPTSGEPYWSYDRAIAAVLGVIAASCLVAAALRAGRVRACIGLVAAAVGLCAFYGPAALRQTGDVPAVWAAFALVAAGTMAVSGRLSRFGGGVALAVGLAVLASQVALPYPSGEQDELTGSAGSAEHVAVAEWADALVHPPEGAGPFGALREPGARLMALFLLGAALGLLVLAGLRARWTTCVAAGLAIATAVMLPIESAVGGRGGAPVEPWLALLVLPTVAGVLDALSSHRDRRSLRNGVT